MVVSIASDHAGYELRQKVRKYLEEKGFEVLDGGAPNGTDSYSYVDAGIKVAEDVSSGKAERGIAICGTGIGISLVCNKYKGPSDDAATANWGNDWCMPTDYQWEELYNNTTNTWTTQNGVAGRLFTASNGNSLFLPAAGIHWDDEFYLLGGEGYYWSSSLYTMGPSAAWNFDFVDGDYGSNLFSRCYGQSVRAVRTSSRN